MAKKADVDPINSAGELAKLVGRNKGTVSRWLARPDWTFGRPPWARAKVPEILRWAAEHLRDRSDVEAAGTTTPAGKSPAAAVAASGGLLSLKEQKLAAEVRKLVAQANAAETALARERGELIDAAEVASQWVRLATAVRNGFASVPAELIDMAITAGLPRGGSLGLTRQFEAAIGRVLSKLSGDDDGVLGDDGDGA